MRVFELIRHEDETGISGIGVVAEGIEFSNGKCAIAWMTRFSSVAVYDSIRLVEAIHGHDGKTEISWTKEKGE